MKLLFLCLSLFEFERMFERLTHGRLSKRRSMSPIGQLTHRLSLYAAMEVVHDQEELHMEDRILHMQ